MNPQLMAAELAATRARFLRQFIGIDEKTLDSAPIFADWHEAQRWRETVANAFTVGPKSALVMAARAAREDWLASAALVADNERETRPVCGVWTLKDVAGHFVDWDAYFLNTLAAMLGEPASDLGWDPDEEGVNDRLAEARRGQAWQQLWDESIQKRYLLINRLNALTQADLARPYSGDAASYPDIYHLFWSVLEHDLDHAATLRRELGVPMDAGLLHFEGPYT